jgi:hypothetical protein
MRSISTVVTLLPLLALSTAFDLDVEVPFNTSASENATAVGTSEDPEWACSIRAWTRAPDLSPGVVVPAETRLVLNGSACGDVVKWEAGLRFKERAIIKRK